VAFYMGSDPEKYGSSVAMAVAECLPDWEFHTYQFGQYGEDEMRELIKNSTVYLRLTHHDGSACSAREFMESGRRVVASLDMDYVRHVRPDDLAQIQKAGIEDEPDWEAHEHYRYRNDPELFRLHMMGIVNE
jgi:hypothetical protein